MSDENNAPKPKVDKELDDLLNSALADMSIKQSSENSAEEITAPAEGAELPWNSEEFMREAAAQFQASMANLIGNVSGVPENEITQEQIAATFSQMAEAAAQVLQPLQNSESTEVGADPPLQPNILSGDDDVQAAIAQTLQSLTTNADNLQAPFSEQDLANMFGNFNLPGSGQEGAANVNMFVPFMQGMMQSLLSKEVLYPSLKDIVDKYPAWLDENKSKLSADDFDRYTKQNEMMKKVCVELESEDDADSDEVKGKRFETVLTLMQKMQDLGQPPVELVGELGLPGAGVPGLPPPGPVPDQQQCCLM